MEPSVTLADLSSIVSGISSALTWFWSIFQSLVESVATNSILLFAVLFSIVAGSVLAAVKVLKRFGIKGHK